ncbi:NADP-dependent oxidoreductase [Pseudonocardia sp. NPDC049635]|uniref:NADP-dependent oxidoreductase n=1 Tax=Pseudonocardia sp. NPDC049635 TaxID=3155506 RepID=UPI0033EFD5CC
MSEIAQIVQFDRYGAPEVLHLTETSAPVPGPREVVVRMRAAALNPLDSHRRSGELRSHFPVTFPGTQGSDLAGVVSAVGPEVTAWRVGDEVIGWNRQWTTHATHVLVADDQLVRKPQDMPWEVAGSLYMIGATAWALVERSGAAPGERALVAGASGGVGSTIVQLLRRRDVEVLAVASERSAEWLVSLGAVPVAYGPGLSDRVHEALAGRQLDTVIDLVGPEYLDLGLAEGVRPDRLVTATSFARAAEVGAAVTGAAAATSTEILQQIVERVTDGRLHIRIAATYPLDDIVAATRHLESGPAGKIVLTHE